MDKQKYIVRCDRSGVFFGEIAERNGQEVTMANVRCLWRWIGAFTLLELASQGTSRPQECRFTATAESLTVLDAIEILPCSDAASKRISEVTPWNP